MRNSLDVLRSVSRYVALGLGEEWEARLWGTEGQFKFPFVRVAQTTPTTFAGPFGYTDCTAGFTVHCYPQPGETPEHSLIEVGRVRELLFGIFENGLTYDEEVGVVPADGIIDVSRESGGTVEVTNALYYYLTALLESGETEAARVGPLTTITNFRTYVFGWNPVKGVIGYRIYRVAPGGAGLIAELSPNEHSYVDEDGSAPDSSHPVPAVTDSDGTVSVTVVGRKRRVPLYDYAGVPLDGADASSTVRHPKDYIRVIDHSIDQGVDPEDETQFRVMSQLRITWRRGGANPATGPLVREVRMRTVAS